MYYYYFIVYIYICTTCTFLYIKATSKCINVNTMRVEIHLNTFISAFKKALGEIGLFKQRCKHDVIL